MFSFIVSSFNTNFLVFCQNIAYHVSIPLRTVPTKLDSIDISSLILQDFGPGSSKYYITLKIF